MELGTPARTKTSAPDPFEQLLLDVNTSRDTLKTADRLEIHHLRQETPVQPISQIEPTRPPDVAAILPQRDSSSVENHHRGAGEKKDVVRKPKPKPKNADGKTNPGPKPTSSGKAPKTNRSKAVVELKPCRPNAFDSLLQALNLSSRCQS